MQILPYLTELVKTRKQVGIPGVGTFYKKKSPGRYDTETHSFLPPSYSLDFTLELREHEALANHISLHKNISFESASYYVDQFSEAIQKQLTEQKTADFGEIGKLSLIDNQLVFDAGSDSNIGFESYGLPTFKDKLDRNQDFLKDNESNEPQITEEQLILEDNNADLSDGSGNFEETHHEEKDIDDQEIYEEISEVMPDIQPVSTPSELIETPEKLADPEEESSKPFYTTSADPGSVWTFNQNTSSALKKDPVVEDPVESHHPKSPSYLKVILYLTGIILLGLVLLYFIKPDFFNGILQNKSATSADSTSIKKVEELKTDSLASADSLKKTILPTDTLADSVTVISPIDTAISYEIIAASLLNKKEADRFLEDMKRKGIPAKVANMPGKRVKISIGTFTDEVAAKKELERLKTTTKIPGIYIYPIKHTHKP